MNKEILKLLEELWEKYPNQRFGQLLENFKIFESTNFYQEDMETIRRLKNAINTGNKYHD